MEKLKKSISIYNRIEDYRQPYILIARQDGNFMLYADRKGHIYSIPTEKALAEGCQGTHFGNTNHIINLMIKGCFNPERLTNTGKSMIKRHCSKYYYNRFIKPLF